MGAARICAWGSVDKSEMLERNGSPLARSASKSCEQESARGRRDWSRSGPPGAGPPIPLQERASMEGSLLD